MSSRSVNLASRPFSNQAPVLRTTLLLLLVVLVLAAVNATLYLSYFSGSGEEARDELEALDTRMDELARELGELDTALAGYDLESMGSQVEFLNLRIAERTFAWSQLFEDLAEVLPRDVRLERLLPRMGRSSGESRATARVPLTLEGVARRDGALLELIDALFAHPRFVDPDPSRESTRNSELRFALTVVYLPGESGLEEVSP